MGGASSLGSGRGFGRNTQMSAAEHTAANRRKTAKQHTTPEFQPAPTTSANSIGRPSAASMTDPPPGASPGSVTAAPGLLVAPARAHQLARVLRFHTSPVVAA